MGVERHSWLDGRSFLNGPSTADTRPGSLSHLFLIEISNFAVLRRSLGVQRADMLILDVSERIAALCPDGNVAIIGRDLVELYVATNDSAGLEALIASARADLGNGVTINGQLHRLELVFGGASVIATEANSVALIERAEQALATARCHVTTASDMSLAASPKDDALIGRELQAAVLNDELFVQYQPKLHLRRQEVTSVEALIRWHHPQRGLVMPNDFIPVAERTGDVAEVTLWTLRQVIKDQRELASNGYDLTVFVNMAGVLLSNQPFVDRVIALIQASGARLGVEITETSVIDDPQGAIGNLKRLSDIGVVVTIDDYGAGLSSLAYLKELPASELKIDKLFVTQLSTSHRDPLIVRSTIDLAHALEMEVVAEGVETPASLALLTVMGCDMVQGFLISRPLTLEALLRYLREERHVPILNAPRPWFGRFVPSRQQA